ncbi:hypothetical protein FGO68_gene16996 [Halteria grandinella]|uniref:Uncharacterized protein n=1 Tax=Halteria grandinella TaxID=5974 RepID=A0A8J8P696_HALGN|nr:hypothetical protein FGO68_gene16996 [Halteria grandinella]
MCLCDTLSKDSRVLAVKKQIYPSELAVLTLLVVPLACVNVAIVVIAADQHWPPVAAARVVSPQSFTRDGVKGASHGVISVFYPLVWETAVILSIVKWFQRQPVSLMDLGVFIVDSQLKEEVFDVEGREEFALTVDHDLAGWLPWDGYERFHNLRVDVCHTLSLLGVEASVDLWVSKTQIKPETGIFCLTFA